MNTEKLKPLTDDELNKLIKETWGLVSIAPQRAVEFARSIEAIVAANEREQCAKIADEFAGDCWIGNADWEAAEYIAAKIRARGKV